MSAKFGDKAGTLNHLQVVSQPQKDASTPQIIMPRLTPANRECFPLIFPLVPVVFMNVRFISFARGWGNPRYAAPGAARHGFD